jgi:hypothetical protein
MVTLFNALAKTLADLAAQGYTEVHEHDAFTLTVFRPGDEVGIQFEEDAETGVVARYRVYECGTPVGNDKLVIELA